MFFFFYLMMKQWLVDLLNSLTILSLFLWKSLYVYKRWWWWRTKARKGSSASGVPYYIFIIDLFFFFLFFLGIISGDCCLALLALESIASPSVSIWTDFATENHKVAIKPLRVLYTGLLLWLCFESTYYILIIREEMELMLKEGQKKRFVVMSRVPCHFPSKFSEGADDRRLSRQLAVCPSWSIHPIWLDPRQPRSPQVDLFQGSQHCFFQVRYF